MVRRRLRLGMVGGGAGAFIGAVHRIAARLDDRYDLVAGAFSADPERGRSSAAAMHVAEDRCYDDFTAMAAEEGARADGIDVVAIVTPNHLHFPIAAAFLRAGIHVICDKPMTATLPDALSLAALVQESGRVFGLTYNYSGYPMVRQAREMVREGRLGTIRTIHVEYAQDWLTTDLESTGHKQAAWRTDPAITGGAGALGDIGTHAFHLAEFVSGLSCTQLAAELSMFVPGRRVDDDAQMLLRFAGGARGMLWASQVAPGHANALRLRLHGSRAAIAWRQETPGTLRFAEHGAPSQTLSRGGPALGPAAAHATRIPAGHPEGYLEAFAQLYTDMADRIAAHDAGAPPDPTCLLLPGVEDGCRGLRFVAAALRSAQDGAVWTQLG
jgi:predicted dehydrogenase